MPRRRRLAAASSASGAAPPPLPEAIPFLWLVPPGAFESFRPARVVVAAASAEAPGALPPAATGALSGGSAPTAHRASATAASATAAAAAAAAAASAAQRLTGRVVQYAVDILEPPREQRRELPSLEWRDDPTYFGT